MKTLLVLWTILLCCPSGFAQENPPDKKLSYQVTEDFTFQRSFLASRPNQFYNSSSVFLKWRNWSGGLTVRGNNYYKQTSNYTLPDSQLDLYRKYAQYTTRKFEIQAGDFYAVLGRGLVLSVLQNDKAFRERTVFGGDFRYHAGGWQIRALGGRVDDEFKERRWHVAGGEVIREYWKGNRVGVHASYIHDTSIYQFLGDRATWGVSWSADKLPKGFSYYTEISRLSLRNSFMDNGSAYYSNLGWTHDHISLLLEYKKYKNFNNELNNPPSADRGDESVDVNDSETIRLFSQYSFFSPDIIPYISVGRVREGDYSGPHIYGGVNASEIGGKLDLSFNYGVKKTIYPLKITDGHVVYRLTDRLAVDLSGRDKRYARGSYRFNEIDFVPQISWAPYGAIFFQKQYSRELVDGRHQFHSGGIRVNVKRDSYVEFSTGATRGGEVCSSGQCIFLPAFRGWKLGVFATVR